MNLAFKEKEKILSEFPQNIKLSYENIVHTKVSNALTISAIPEGKKCFVWFTRTQDDEKPVCYLMELERKRQISKIKIIDACFDASLSYGGSIVYGTLFHYQKQAFFSMEDLFYYQGKALMNECASWTNKLSILNKIMKKQILQKAYHSMFIVFGLPLMDTDYENLVKKIEGLPYKIYCLQFRKNHSLDQMHHKYIYQEKQEQNMRDMRDTEVKQMIQNVNPLKTTQGQTQIQAYKNNPYKKERVCKVKADIQNDIYHLYCVEKDEYLDVAYIPDYKTSIMMNRLFRNIKENENLDALEESDDEDEFENEKEDRFVFLDREYRMICNYHYKFKKWVPIRQVTYSK